MTQMKRERGVWASHVGSVLLLEAFENQSCLGYGAPLVDCNHLRDFKDYPL